MSRWLKSPAFYFLLVLALVLRYWQAGRSFEIQREYFGPAQKGLFTVWVSEEPEVLFDRLSGSHDTGREGGVYQPFVKEVRAVCTLIAVKNENLTEVASSPNAPIGAALRNDSYIKLPPIKVRCAFRISPGIPQPVLSYGDEVVIEGKIQVPAPAMNPGQFDYADYLKTKGVADVMYASPGKWKKVPQFPPSPPLLKGGERGVLWNEDTHGWFFLRWSCGLKRWAEDTLYRFLPFPENALLDGILLGERSPLPDKMVESFFLTGTIHILAVSGMITAFIAGLLFMVFRTLQFGRKWAAGLGLVGLFFFILMTGAHPPVCRAGLFSALALLAVILERRIHGGVLLIATAVLLAAWNPFVLGDLSFQISFLATAGLMVMSSWMMKKLAFLWRPAALLVTATTAAQLAVWCLIVNDFNQMSLYSVLSNLLIVPLALFATAGGLVLLAGAAVHPALGTLFGAACEAPLKLLILLSNRLAQLPHAGWIVASPPVFWVAVFHTLLLVTFFWFWPRPRPEKPSENWKGREGRILNGRRWTAWAWVIFLLGTAAAWAFSALKAQPLRLAFLDVGHGNAVVFRSPDGRVLVMDGGKETHGPDRYNLLVSYLRHAGIQKVDGVLNTHPDEDHVGGLVNLLGAYAVGRVYVGAQAQSDSAIYRKFQDSLLQHHLPLQQLKEGDGIHDLEPARVAVLHPPAGFKPRIHADNNSSLASLVSFGGINVLVPGDLEKEGLLKLLKDNRPFPHLDWLMAPHHGRLSGEPLLCAKGFKPRFVVLSDWRDYPDDHADFQSVVPDAVVISTAEEGAVEVEIWPEGQGRYRTWKDPEWKNFSSQSAARGSQ